MCYRFSKVGIEIQGLTEHGQKTRRSLNKHKNSEKVEGNIEKFQCFYQVFERFLASSDQYQ